MSKRFTPRKKKPTIPIDVTQMKTVRIDANTVISVKAHISDEEARAKWIARHRLGKNAPANARQYPMTPDESFEDAKPKITSLDEIKEIENMSDEE